MRSSSFENQVQKGNRAFLQLSIAHLIVVSGTFFATLISYFSSDRYQLFFLALLLLQFGVAQLYGLQLFRRRGSLSTATWIILGALSVLAIATPLFLKNALILSLAVSATFPFIMAATDQLRRLPVGLFITFTTMAMTILIDLLAPWEESRIQMSSSVFLIVVGLLLIYGCFLLFLFFMYSPFSWRSGRLRLNLATQYALVMSCVSALVIVLVTSVLITQIRDAQVNQVGKNFQTIAENFAKLAGSHLEQQMQKLQLLTQHVPILHAGLLESNSQYLNGRVAARRLLDRKNTQWQKPLKDNAFVMGYLNSPIIEALSLFRGHNSFHNDILFVDGQGGLVASLGQIPERFYFYDQRWYQVCWNGGLGDIFLGDLQLDKRSQIPKIRIAVDVVEHSSNRVIGVLSSMYLLRTLIEDIERFMPETVESISLVDTQGTIITSTSQNLLSKKKWVQLKDIPARTTESGWALGNDHKDQAALIGFASLSTTYNVISDPLHRLGWNVVVSGSRTSALAEVTQSTKLAMLVGLAAMALSVLVAIAAARVITRPIENLTTTARVMSEGNLESRAELTGPDELITLSEGFNRLTSQLHQVINNLQSQTQQLAKAKSEAETATKLKGQFLANMSHEIRTPLNAILGFADMLESSLDEGQKKGYARTIKSSGNDLLHLINDILDLSKIEANRLELHHQTIEMQQLFLELKRIFSISAKEKNLELDMDVAEDLPPLMLDGVRLKQVLFNLLGNAVKFTEHGRVICKAEVSYGKGESEFCSLTLTVRDDGIGISPENHAKIFNVFQQQSSNSRASIEGTGLGLTISKNLVEMMGGTILVEGEVGVGSTFTVALPRVAIGDPDSVSSKVSAENQAEPETVLFQKVSLLIVDDLEVNRRLLVEKFKNYPFQITIAENGRRAVELTHEVKYDLILMDIRMPDMDGYTALAKIRRGNRSGETPVIAITASGMQDDRERIIQAGFNDYLIRPFRSEDLVNLLTKYLPFRREVLQRKDTEVTTLINFEPSEGENWSCSPEVEQEIDQLHEDWRNVLNKQSMLQIRRFAERVDLIGQDHAIELLSRYGGELKRYADDFDIEKVEKLLNVFDKILSSRKSNSS